ncbi:hypothetical protein [Burkholderia vietnamiensis]|uniref:hypothetical protein n=1 Tax=Burkholderia vietnamiensis TaxID=60552 RepID=UPI000A476161|nr:hypothetical protein [Burkholderia vietnamiensis]
MTTTDNSRADALTDEQIRAAIDTAISENGTGELLFTLARVVERTLAAPPVERPAAAPIDDLRQEVLRLCRLFLDDEQDKYNAKAVMTQIFSLAAAPTPSLADERAAFKVAHPHLDLSEKPDAWNRPAFVHSHVDAMFAGWQARAASANEPGTMFQARVQPWMLACFGAEIAADRAERNHRFFEEAGELVQACGMTREEAHALVDYTWSRPVGEPTQEVGGVMVTLAALCLAKGLDMHAAGETELARVWTKVEQIRAKQAAKPKHSPLPVAVEPVGLTYERIKAVAEEHWSSCRYVDDECIYEFDREDLTGFARALIAAAPQPAQADARVGLTDDEWKAIRALKGYVEDRSSLIARESALDLALDCVARLLAAHPGQPEPRASAGVIAAAIAAIDAALAQRQGEGS